DGGDVLPVRGPGRFHITGAAEAVPLAVGDGPHVPAVGARHVDIRLVEAGAGEDDRAAVWRDVGVALVADAVDQDPLVGPGRPHRPDVAVVGAGVGVAVADVDDAAAVGGEDRVPGAAGSVSQLMQATAVD